MDLLLAHHSPPASGRRFDLSESSLALKWASSSCSSPGTGSSPPSGLPPADGITWVLSIVGLVLVVRSALIPLFVKQIKSQRKMMEIAPELRKVQDKYKGKKDQLSREAMSRETMALYKKHGTNPRLRAVCRCSCRCRSSSRCSGC